MRIVDLVMNLIDNINRIPDSLKERARSIGAEEYKVHAMDIAGWVYFTLSASRPVPAEKTEYVFYFANILISQIAWEMCGVKH